MYRRMYCPHVLPHHVYCTHMYCLQDDAHEAFIEVQAAYTTLSEPDTRAAYDRTLGLRRLNFFRDVEVRLSDLETRWQIL